MALDQLTKHMASDGKGFYQDLGRFNAEHESSVGNLEFFAAEAKDKYGFYPEDDLLKRREDHFMTKFQVRGFEPVRAERVRKYAADSWAIEKYFAEHKCPIHGMASPTVEKAFTTTSLQGAFPIFFSAALTEGTLVSPILDQLVGETIPTNSGIANHTELADPVSTSANLNVAHPLQQVSEIGEGTRATQVIVTFRERQIPLRAFGYELLATYEALRRVRLPVLQRTIARIGTNFQNLLTDFAIDVLVLGDGTLPSNAATTVAAAVPGTPSYSDYVNLDLGMPQGYDSTVWIMNKEAIVKMLNVPEFKDPLAGFQFQNRGLMPAPFGKRVIRWDTTGNTTAWPNTATNAKILALNPNAALTQYTEGGIVFETENIISMRWAKSVFSTWVAYGLGDPAQRVVGTGFA